MIAGAVGVCAVGDVISEHVDDEIEQLADALAELLDNHGAWTWITSRARAFDRLAVLDDGGGWCWLVEWSAGRAKARRMRTSDAQVSLSERAAALDGGCS